MKSDIPCSLDKHSTRQFICNFVCAINPCTFLGDFPVYVNILHMLSSSRGLGLSVIGCCGCVDASLLSGSFVYTQFFVLFVVVFCLFACCWNLLLQHVAADVFLFLRIAMSNGTLQLGAIPVAWRLFPHLGGIPLARGHTQDPVLDLSLHPRAQLCVCKFTRDPLSISLP